MMVISKKNTGKLFSLATKEKLRIHTLRRIENGDFKHINTKPYIEFGKILTQLGLSYVSEKIVNYWSFDYSPSFIICIFLLS